MGILTNWQQRIKNNKTNNESNNTTTEPLPPKNSQNKEKKILTAEDLPDPTKIGEGGDFSCFMQDNVDPELKIKALRELWKQHTTVDDLSNYAEDYTKQRELTEEESLELAQRVIFVPKDDEEIEDDASLDDNSNIAANSDLTNIEPQEKDEQQIKAIDNTLQEPDLNVDLKAQV